MRANFYVPLVDTMLESSLWKQDATVLKLFLTFLLLKDSRHRVRRDEEYVQKRSGLTDEQFDAALKVLESADPDATPRRPQPHDGKRVLRMPDGFGWLVVTGEFYQKEMKRINGSRREGPGTTPKDITRKVALVNKPVDLDAFVGRELNTEENHEDVRHDTGGV